MFFKSKPMSKILVVALIVLVVALINRATAQLAWSSIIIDSESKYDGKFLECFGGGFFVPSSG